MNTKVIALRAGRPPIGHFIRIGTSGFRQVEDLVEEGRFPADRVVIEACKTRPQAELVAALRKRGCETVLDTNVAELSAIGKYDGVVGEAPWALGSRAFTPDDFGGMGRARLVNQIAEFASSFGFSAVLAPSHILGSARDPWLAIDLALCRDLRDALDASGAGHIAVDYALITPYRVLRRPDDRALLVKSLSGLPVENLWVRTSQFGADATPTGVRRFIEALRDFHQLHYPIVVDDIAGLAGLATVAFGASGGIAHGLADHERFDASAWSKPRPQVFGGLPKRILVPWLDRHVAEKQFRMLASANGGRRLVCCVDVECCRRGLDDTIDSPKAHYIFQRHKQVATLSSVPEARRADHFLRNDVLSAERRARQIARLKVSDYAVKQMLDNESKRLERMYLVLDSLLNEGAFKNRSMCPRHRPIQPATSKEAI